MFPKVLAHLIRQEEAEEATLLAIYKDNFVEVDSWFDDPGQIVMVLPPGMAVRWNRKVRRWGVLIPPTGENRWVSKADVVRKGKSAFLNRHIVVRVTFRQWLWDAIRPELEWIGQSSFLRPSFRCQPPAPPAASEASKSPAARWLVSWFTAYDAIDMQIQEFDDESSASWFAEHLQLDRATDVQIQQI